MQKRTTNITTHENILPNEVHPKSWTLMEVHIIIGALFYTRPE